MITKEQAPAVHHRTDNRIAMAARHLGVMLVAMLVGMMTLYPLWVVAVSSFASNTWLESFEVTLLAMATAMTVPMVAWMIRRGDGRAAANEMGAAMYAAFLLPLAFYWVGQLGESAVMVTGHVLMVVFMIVLAWRHTSGHAHHESRTDR
jgi:hypothetical protein